MNTKRILIILIFFLSKGIYCQSPIIPTPVVYKSGNETLFFGNQFSLNDDNLPAEIKEFLIQKLVNNFSIQTVVSGSSKNLIFKKVVNTPPDFYSIDINEGILIRYSSDASCFYAVNSLLQLIEGEKDNYYFTKCFIQDYPKFQWRGLHLDVSRHFYTVEEVKRFIDLMSLYKFNTFHWHLTDDQGWRIEIKKYPKLTEIGAWRDSTVNNHYTTQPRTYTVEKYGGYYSQDEIKDIVAYASKRFITVVPEIEMPGHSRAALAAYPEYSCTGKQLEVPGLWGVFEEIFCAKEQSINFLKDILDEVLELFPSEYIHIGGDEAPKTRWETCPRCQKVIRENGLKDEHELQSFFIKQIDLYLTSKGRKLIGWDEILEGGLSPNAAVMSWRGFEGGIEAAKQEHFVVMSPGSHCYFDHYQSTSPNEPLAIGGYTPLEKVYEFNPVPAEFSEQQAFYILGGQANLWTEYITNMNQLEYMTYPRALALSQALWSQNKPPFEEFEKSFIKYHLTYLKRFNVNYSNAFFYPKMEVSSKLNGLNVHFKGQQEDYQFDLSIQLNGNVSDTNVRQIVGENDSLYFERTVDNKIDNYKFTVSSKHSTSPTEFKFIVHPSIGLPVEYLTTPNPRYNTGGNLALVDGIVGSLPWRGNEWTGFDTSSIELIVDLKKVVTISSFLINFLEDQGSWIYLPKTVEILYSKNKRKWKSLPPQNVNSGMNEKNSNFLHKQNVDKKARYVKVCIKADEKIALDNPGAGHVPWTFIDELILFYK